jgi:hypothetical protein
MGYTCAVCGETHSGETRDIRMTLPEAIHALEEDERRARAALTEDSAVLDGERWFVRGLLELPIEDEEGYFGYGVWVEVSEADFAALAELWHDEDGWRQEPFAGTLANELVPHEGTLGLPLRLRLRDVSLLPLVELDDAEHELVEEQRHGLTSHRLHELAAAVA